MYSDAKTQPQHPLACRPDALVPLGRYSSSSGSSGIFNAAVKPRQRPQRSGATRVGGCEQKIQVVSSSIPNHAYRTADQTNSQTMPTGCPNNVTLLIHYLRAIVAECASDSAMSPADLKYGWRGGDLTLKQHIHRVVFAFFLCRNYGTPALKRFALEIFVQHLKNSDHCREPIQQKHTHTKKNDVATTSRMKGYTPHNHSWIKGYNEHSDAFIHVHGSEYGSVLMLNSCQWPRELRSDDPNTASEATSENCTRQDARIPLERNPHRGVRRRKSVGKKKHYYR